MAINFKSISDSEKIILETSNLTSQTAGMTVNGATKIHGTWQEVGIKKENQVVKEIELIKVT
jgi:hypothetical protein